MKERIQIRGGGPRRIVVFSRKPPLVASENISLEGESGLNVRVALAAAVASQIFLFPEIFLI